MYSTRYRDELDEPTAREFDALSARLKALFFAEHNEDGSHNFDPDGVLNDTITKIIDGYQTQGQWWKQGPWHLNEPGAGEPKRAIIRPPDPAAGTYNDYAPPGIDTAIGMQIEPTGDITITGIKNEDISKERMFFLRNRDNSNTITLAHEDTGSLAAYRFDLPNGEDVVLGGDQNAWLFYDTGRERWTYTITGNTSGGIPDSSLIKVATLSVSEAQFESFDGTAGSNITVVPAPGAGKIITPLKFIYKVVVTTGYSTSPAAEIRYEGQTTNIWGTGAASLTTAGTRMAVPADLAFTTTFATFDPTNKAIQVNHAAAAGTPGTGVATAKYTVFYTTFDV